MTRLVAKVAMVGLVAIATGLLAGAWLVMSYLTLGARP